MLLAPKLFSSDQKWLPKHLGISNNNWHGQVLLYVLRSQTDHDVQNKT